MANQERVNAGAKFQEDAGILGTIVGVFYNFEKDKAVMDYEQAMDKLQTNMDNLAENYPDLQTIMKKEGLMTPDGRLKPDKFIDQDYLDALDDRMSEAESKQIGALLKNARVNAATRGIGGGLSNVGLAGQMNEMSRNMNRQFGDAYKSESDQARAMTLNMGKNYQSDALNQETAKMNAILNDVAAKRENMNAQSDGLLQSPEGMMALGQMIGGVVSTNPAMIVGGLNKAAGATGGGVNSKGGRDAPYNPTFLPMQNRGGSNYGTTNISDTYFGRQGTAQGTNPATQRVIPDEYSSMGLGGSQPRYNSK